MPRYCGKLNRIILAIAIVVACITTVDAVYTITSHDAGDAYYSGMPQETVTISTSVAITEQPDCLIDDFTLDVSGGTGFGCNLNTAGGALEYGSYKLLCGSQYIYVTVSESNFDHCFGYGGDNTYDIEITWVIPLDVVNGLYTATASSMGESDSDDFTISARPHPKPPTTTVAGMTTSTSTTTTTTSTTTTTLCGRLTIHKYNDSNRNAEMDVDENGLNEFMFDVTGVDYQSRFTTVNDGSVTALCVPLGDYTVTENLRTGFIPTTENPQTITMDDPNVDYALSFGNFDLSLNYRCGYLRINKFNDENSNKDWDIGEPGLAGIPFTVTGGDKVASVVTQLDGIALTECLDYGDYLVEEEVPEGWEPTTDNPQEVSIEELAIYNDIWFGNVFASSTTTSTTLEDEEEEDENDEDGDGIPDDEDPDYDGPGTTLNPNDPRATTIPPLSLSKKLDLELPRIIMKGEASTIYVTDEGRPIKAKVTIIESDGTKKTVTTDEDGMARVIILTTGRTHFIATKENYHPASGDSIVIDISELIFHPYSLTGLILLIAGGAGIMWIRTRELKTVISLGFVQGADLNELFEKQKHVYVSPSLNEQIGSEYLGKVRVADMTDDDYERVKRLVEEYNLDRGNAEAVVIAQNIKAKRILVHEKDVEAIRRILGGKIRIETTNI
ncbi:SpaA isopeptide-forming pilin-related protein [Candidatus Altiarchaeota archaeon]